MRARNEDLYRHSLYIIKPLIGSLKYLQKRYGLIDLVVVEGTKVPVDELKLPIQHKLND
jgi:hypothetical protein